MKKIIFTTLGVLTFTIQANTNFLPTLLMKYPQVIGTPLGDCMVCHTVDKWQRNDFGLDLQNWLRENYDGAELNPLERTYMSQFIEKGLEGIEQMDSDGDEVLNYEEFNNLTLPGDSTSF